MPSFIIRRSLTTLLSLLLASLLVFSALLAIPGDPAQVILGLDANPQALAALRSKLGLDLPAPQRFLNWVTAAARGDLGESLNYQKPVSDLIAGRLGVSVPLAVGAAILAVLIALPLGILAAVMRRTPLDPLITSLAQLGAAVPSFWLGLLLILYFAVRLRVLPAGGFVPWEKDMWGALRSLLLPVLALGLSQAAVMTRMTRAVMIENLSADYVRTARAKGLNERRVVVGHTLRNALVTLVTVFGLSLANVFIGSIIIEQVFSLPGLGSMALRAIGSRDFPLVQGVVLVYASAIIRLSRLVDISYGLLDPRIRYS
jgi:peptide/nickel transport system permease protein